MSTILRFFASDVAAKGVAVLFIPMYSYFLGPEQLGQFSEWFSLFNVFVAILGMGVPSYVLVLLSRSPEHEDSIKRKSIRFLFEWFLFAAVVNLISSYFIDNIYYSVGLFVASLCFVIINFVEIVLRYQKLFNHYFCLQLSLAMATSAVPLLFVYFDPNWESRVQGYVAGILLVMSVVIVLSISKFGIEKIDNTYRKDVLLFGSSVVLMTMVAWCKVGADIQLLKYLDGYNSSGILFFSFQMVAIVSIVAASLNRSSSPVFYELLKNNQSHNFWVLIYRLGGIISALSVAVVIACWILVKYFLQEFEQSLGMIVPMSIGSVLYGVGQFVGAIFLYQKKPYILTWAIAISSLVHPISSYLLITYKGWDMIGLSYLISSALFLVLVFLLLQKVDRKQTTEIKASRFRKKALGRAKRE